MKLDDIFDDNLDNISNLLLNKAKTLKEDEDFDDELEDEFDDDELDDDFGFQEYTYSMEDLINAVQDGNYIDASDAFEIVQNEHTIDEIITDLSHNTTPKQVQPLLKKYKKDIIVNMLGDMKHQTNLDSVTATLEGLDRSQVTWPELAVIRKSLMAIQAAQKDSRKRRGIKEDLRSLEVFIKADVKRSLETNQIGSALQVIRVDLKVNPGNLAWFQDNIVPLLLEHKKKILKWFIHGLTWVTIPRVVSAYKLLEKLGIAWPELMTLVEDHKDHIIKKLLEVIKRHQTVNPVIKDLEYLHELGITWPELDIIAKSHSAEKTVDEGLKLDDEFYDIRDITDAIKGERWNTVATILPKALHSGRYGTFGDILDSVAYNLEAADFRKFLNQFKSSIVKYTLTKIKNGQKTEMNTLIKVFDRADVDWPELDIIKRSLRADNWLNVDPATWVTEDVRELDSETVRHMTYIIKRDLKGTTSDSLNYVMRKMVEWDVTLNQLPEIKKIFEDNKEDIIRSILKFINRVQDLLPHTAETINLLHTIGIDWPELDIIRKSILSDRAKSDAHWVEESSSKSLWEIYTIYTISAVNQHNEAGALEYWREYLDGGRSISDLILEITKKAQTNASWFFDLVKDDIVRSILRNIKSQHSWDQDEAKVIVRALKKVDVKWPELDAIYRSLRADKKLRENEDLEDALFNEWHNFLDEMDEGHTSLAMGDLNKYLSYGGSVEKANQALEKRKATVINSLEIAAGHANISIFNNIVKTVKKVGITWPELDINNYKDPTVKHLLEMFKGGSMMMLRTTLRDLKNNGVDWPELDIISKSLEHEIQKRLAETEESDWFTKRMLDDAMMYLGNGEMGPAIHWLLLYIRNNGDMRLARDGLEKNRNKIIAYMEKRLQAVEFILALDVGKIITAAGLKWPEVANMFEANKDTIVKGLLSYYKRTNPASTKTKVMALKRSGVDWPELDIILRSADADLANK